MDRCGPSKTSVEENPCSVPNDKSVKLLVMNNTNCLVHVIWLDFKGEPIIYCTLGCNHGIQINTYEHHPWKVVNALTGDKMLIGGKEIYYPVQEHDNVIITVFISRPLLTLRECALRKIRDNAPAFESEALHTSELPSTLIKDLQKELKLKLSTLYRFSTYKKYRST